MPETNSPLHSNCRTLAALPPPWKDTPSSITSYVASRFSSELTTVVSNSYFSCTKSTELAVLMVPGLFSVFPAERCQNTQNLWLFLFSFTQVHNCLGNSTSFCSSKTLSSLYGLSQKTPHRMRSPFTSHQISVFTAGNAKKSLVFLQNTLNIISVYASPSELISEVS